MRRVSARNLLVSNRNAQFDGSSPTPQPIFSVLRSCIGRLDQILLPNVRLARDEAWKEYLLSEEGVSRQLQLAEQKLIPEFSESCPTRRHSSEVHRTTCGWLPAREKGFQRAMGIAPHKQCCHSRRYWDWRLPKCRAFQVLEIFEGGIHKFRTVYIHLVCWGVDQSLWAWIAHVGVIDLLPHAATVWHTDCLNQFELNRFSSLTQLGTRTYRNLSLFPRMIVALREEM